jgi:hypothetical protein
MVLVPLLIIQKMFTKGMAEQKKSLRKAYFDFQLFLTLTNETYLAE